MDTVRANVSSDCRDQCVRKGYSTEDTERRVDERRKRPWMSDTMDPPLSDFEIDWLYGIADVTPAEIKATRHKIRSSSVPIPWQSGSDIMYAAC